MKFNTPLPLGLYAQHYHWGKKAKDSLVADLLSEGASEKHFAELWVGAHPTLSSDVAIEAEPLSLSELIATNPVEMLGEAVFKKFGATLPFLFGPKYHGV